MKKAAFLLIIILVIPLVQSGEEWQTYESEHFIFYYDEEYLTSQEIETIAQNQEELFSRITGMLAIQYTQKITYYLYGNRLDFGGIPGAYAMGSEIHFLCIFCFDFCKDGLNDAHELTHSLSDSIGLQYGLLAEGLAVYIEDSVMRGVNLHGIIKILHTEGRLTSLEDLYEDFWCDILYNYDIAGSFTQFLIEEYGIEKYKQLYSYTLFTDIFPTIYGKSFSEVRDEWLDTVEQAEVTEKEIDIIRYRDGIKEGLSIYFELDFGSPEYGTYPARAEEGICLFRREHPDDPEGAFSHLDQFNEGMVAWKEAIETFKDALIKEDIEVRLELFRKASDLYKIAGDEEMITLSGKYVSALESLVEIRVHLEEGELTKAEEELERVTPLLQELGEEEEVYAVAHDFRILKERNIQELETGITVLFLFICVMIAGIVIRKIK